MKSSSFLRTARIAIALSLALSCLALATVARSAEWDPNAFRTERTLEFLTIGPDEGEHWSTVWLVVIDGQLYARLGTTAAGRMERNTAAPYVKVRVAGQEFDRVRVESVPEMAERVGAAMADKYWMDVLVRHESHPMTAKLAPEPPAPPR